MGTRKQINLRISGSRVLGRLKKSCNCCGNPDIYAIHLLPTAYPSKKISKFKREEKKEKKSLKTISRFNGGAHNSTYSHSLILFKRKNIKPIRKFFFPLPLFFVITFLLHYFFSFFNLHIKLEKKRNILKEKKINYKSRRWHIIPAA